MCNHICVQLPEEHLSNVLSGHLLFYCDCNKSYNQICSPYLIIFSVVHSDTLWHLTKIAPEYYEHPYIFTVNTLFHILVSIWLHKTQNICDWCSLGPIRGTFVSEKASFPEKHSVQDDHGIFMMQICLTSDRYTVYSVCSRKSHS